MSDKNIFEFNNILHNFKIQAQCLNHKEIDNYFFYDLRLSPQTKIKEIEKCGDELALMLKTPCKPNIKILHKEGVIRLEFVSKRKNILNLFDYFTNDNVPDGELICLLGQAIDGSHVWMDLAKNPHMIISGTTGSGKSVLLHNILANLFNYNKSIIYLIDPKNIEFSEYYSKIKCDLNVSFNYYESLFVLDSLLELMELRYCMLQSGGSKDEFPYVVLIIDEFADLIMQDSNKEFYNKLCKLSQKCRAAKIHIIISTQRPSANIINGSIKANFPTRISCRVASHVDSKIILDTVGAENLMGNGDALIKDNYRSMERFQIAYTNAKEVCSYFSDSIL